MGFHPLRPYPTGRSMNVQDLGDRDRNSERVRAEERGTVAETRLVAACAGAADRLERWLVHEVEDFESLSPSQSLLLDAWALLSLVAERVVDINDELSVLPDPIGPKTAEAPPIRDMAGASAVVEARQGFTPPTLAEPATGWPSPSSPPSQGWAIHRIAGTLTAVALTSTLLGCGANDGEVPSARVTVTATPSVSDSLRPAPTDAAELLDDGSTIAPSPASTLVWDAGSKAEAAQSATVVMQRFARPTAGSVRQWWPRLRPLLTGNAQADYEWVDPMNVPVTSVTGPARVDVTSKASVARVHVSTNAGTYLVVLNRTDAAPQWVADRILPPGESQ